MNYFHSKRHVLVRPRPRVRLIMISWFALHWPHVIKDLQSLPFFRCSLNISISRLVFPFLSASFDVLVRLRNWVDFPFFFLSFACTRFYCQQTFARVNQASGNNSSVIVFYRFTLMFGVILGRKAIAHTSREQLNRIFYLFGYQITIISLLLLSFFW